MSNKSTPTTSELKMMHPREYRSLVRQGKGVEYTQNVCQGYQQLDLAIVPKEYAFEFLLYCDRNPRPCPVNDVTEPGSPHPMKAAPEADLRTDLGAYRVFIDGKLECEPPDIKDYWRDDLVAFLLGCSWSFEWALRAANVNFRFIGAYTTNIPCVPAGPFRGPLVVSCRLFKSSHDAIRAVQISTRHPASHGQPVHIGEPAAIGIKDLYEPDILKPPWPVTPQQPGEVALYWACAITPQTAAREAKLPLMITGVKSTLFISDLLVEELSVL